MTDQFMRHSLQSELPDEVFIWGGKRTPRVQSDPVYPLHSTLQFEVCRLIINTYRDMFTDYYSNKRASKSPAGSHIEIVGWARLEKMYGKSLETSSYRLKQYWLNFYTSRLHGQYDTQILDNCFGFNTSIVDESEASVTFDDLIYGRNPSGALCIIGTYEQLRKKTNTTLSKYLQSEGWTDVGEIKPFIVNRPIQQDLFDRFV